MPRESRKEKEKRQRREHVMEAAEELFAEQGFEATTMDQIAHDAELSKSTFYTLFRSKEELLCAMELRDAKLGHEVLRDGATNGVTGREKMLEYGRAFYRFYRENPGKLLLRSFLDFRGVARGAIDQELEAQSLLHNAVEADLLHGIIAEGQADGTIDSTRPTKLIASHFIYTLHPIAKQALFSTHRFASFDGDEYFGSYLTFFVNGLRPEPESVTS